ncbi:MAG: Crp/Fnr family transcriptional regulator [Bacteroidota bacterium]
MQREIPPFLQQLFVQFGTVTEADLALISPLLQTQFLPKGAHFLSLGQTCDKIGLLTKGILRAYYPVGEREVTSYFNFLPRNPIVAGFTSLLTQKPATEALQALEDCELLYVTYKQLQYLYQSSQNFERLGRIMMEQNYIASVKRIQSYQTQSAADRYQHLLSKYPNLLNRIPHHYIASYLGITPESLSRIRKQK